MNDNGRHGVIREDCAGVSLSALIQVLACLGTSERSALLDHMSVGEAMHLIQVSQQSMPASCAPHLKPLSTACPLQWSNYSDQGISQWVKTPRGVVLLDRRIGARQSRRTC